MISVDLQKTRIRTLYENIVTSTVCLFLLGYRCLAPDSAVSADEIKSRAAVVMDAETGRCCLQKTLTSV